MPLLTALSYDPTLKTVTVAGDISTANLTSIINQTRGKDLFVIGQTSVTNRVFSEGNTIFTLDTNTIGDSANDVLVVRYQSSNIITAIPDGGFIGGVAHFVRSTEPSVRIDGSALSVNDRWYKSDDGSEWFWNGLYWTSSQRFFVFGSRSNNTASGTIVTQVIASHLESSATPVGFLLESVECYWQSPSSYYVYSPSNYWGVSCSLYPTDADAGAITTLNNVALTSANEGPNSTNRGSRQLITINTAYLNNGLTYRQLLYLQLSLVKTGTPNPLALLYTKLNYRLIA